MKHYLVWILLHICMASIFAQETDIPLESGYVQLIKDNAILYGKVELLSPYSTRLLSVNDSTVISLDYVQYYQSNRGFYTRYTNEVDGTIFFPRKVISGRIDVFANDETFHPSNLLRNDSTPNFSSNSARSLYFSQNGSDLLKVNYGRIRYIVQGDSKSKGILDKYRNMKTVGGVSEITGLACLAKMLMIMVDDHPDKNQELYFGVSAAGFFAISGTMNILKKDLIKDAIIEYNK